MRIGAFVGALRKAAPGIRTAVGLWQGKWGDESFRDDIDGRSRTIERRLAMGTLIGAVEILLSARDFRRDGVLAWKANGGMEPLWTRRESRMLDRLMEYPQFLLVPAVQALASVALLSPGRSRVQRGVLTGVLLATVRLSHRHHRTGYDGSDQITDVGLVSVALEKVFSADSRARHACLQFLAYQTCVGYFSSGSVKFFSRTWRSGEAITGIFRTGTYGDDSFSRVVNLHPAIPRLLAWTVIVGEMTFPLVLVAPKPVSRAILAAAGAFHLANARLMGLNRFVWGFTGTYPAISHVSKSLR